MRKYTELYIRSLFVLPRMKLLEIKRGLNRRVSFLVFFSTLKPEDRQGLVPFRLRLAAITVNTCIGCQRLFRRECTSLALISLASPRYLVTPYRNVYLAPQLGNQRTLPPNAVTIVLIQSTDTISQLISHALCNVLFDGIGIYLYCR